MFLSEIDFSMKKERSWERGNRFVLWWNMQFLIKLQCHLKWQICLSKIGIYKNLESKYLLPIGTTSYTSYGQVYIP